MNDAESTFAKRYKVTHLTRYRYDQNVNLARHLLHLSPRPLPWQTCHRHDIQVLPHFAIRSQRFDTFGNPVEHLIIEQPHHELTVVADSEIEVATRPALPSHSQHWEEMRHQLTYQPHQKIPAEVLDATRYVFESPLIRIKREFAAWATPCFKVNMPLHESILALNQKIHYEIIFDPEATHVSTTVLEVLAKKRGVCQDFAHLMLACLRSHGLACRYMSGYLLTHPPQGQERLIGADASHAWVAVYCPDYGWLEVDPTNNCVADQRHILLGWGRDFNDISPLRGVIIGGGTHEPEIEVTVLPLD